MQLLSHISFPAITVIAVILVPAQLSASEPMSPVTAGQSATKARDINGFELGMPISGAISRVSVSYRQGDLVQSSLDGIEYDFSYCPSGRLYRIESRQRLGYFVPDQKFSSNLKAKLLTKYGATQSNASDSFGWSLVEPVNFSDGEVRLFKTNWFSVMLTGGYGTPIEIHMKMLDFRICWEDKVRLNKEPRDQAIDKVEF